MKMSSSVHFKNITFLGCRSSSHFVTEEDFNKTVNNIIEDFQYIPEISENQEFLFESGSSDVLYINSCHGYQKNSAAKEIFESFKIKNIYKIAMIRVDCVNKIKELINNQKILELSSSNDTKKNISHDDLSTSNESHQSVPHVVDNEILKNDEMSESKNKNPMFFKSKSIPSASSSSLSADDQNDEVTVIVAQSKQKPGVKLYVFYQENRNECAKFNELISTQMKNISASLNIPKVPEKIDYVKMDYELVVEIFESADDMNYFPVPRDKNEFKLIQDNKRKVRVIAYSVSNNETNVNFFDCISFEMRVSSDEIKTEEYTNLSNVKVCCVSDGSSFYVCGDWTLFDIDFVSDSNADSKSKYLADFRIKMRAEMTRDIMVINMATNFYYYNGDNRFRITSKVPTVFGFSLIFSKSKTARTKKLSFIGFNQETNTSFSSLQHLQLDYMLDYRKLNKTLMKAFEIADNFLGNINCGKNGNDIEIVFSGCYQENYTKLLAENKYEWDILIEKWKKFDTIPDEMLLNLKRGGIHPEVRRDIWSLLTGAHTEVDKLRRIYYQLLKENTTFNKIISWDVKRTFPYHSYFAQVDGRGQKSLSNVCKAYSLYDKETGYCQGMSFIIALLLLLYDEVEAFTVFVKLMYKFKQREVYMNSFSALQESIFVFKRLFFKHIKDLYQSFENSGVDVHMFYTQWILTLFTSKFPLAFSFKLFDFFLTEGCDSLYKISLSLLMLSKNDLIKLNFDDALGYLKLGLPKLYISESNICNLFNTASKIDISKNELDSLKSDYKLINSSEQQICLIDYLKEEKKDLLNHLCRVEMENDRLTNTITCLKKDMKNIERDRTSASEINKELNCLKLDKKYNSDTIDHYKVEYDKLVASLDTLNNQNIKLSSDYEALEAEFSNLKTLSAKKDEHIKRLTELIKDSNSNLVSERSDNSNLALNYPDDINHELVKTKLAYAEALLTIEELKAFSSSRGSVVSKLFSIKKKV